MTLLIISQFQVLADALPESMFPALGTWLNVMVFLAGLVLMLLNIVGFFRAKKEMVPNPLVTERKPEFVNRREFDGLKTEVHETRLKIDTLTQQINTVHVDLLEKGAERAEQLNGRINDILSALKSPNRPK
jgi:hypothetical protein